MPKQSSSQLVSGLQPGLYSTTPVPNPELVALGPKFGTMEEFMGTEVKK
jgi:hypothetical protein